MHSELYRAVLTYNSLCAYQIWYYSALHPLVKGTLGACPFAPEREKWGRGPHLLRKANPLGRDVTSSCSKDRQWVVCCSCFRVDDTLG